MSVEEGKKQVGGKYILLFTALLWSTAGVCVKLLPWGAFTVSFFRSMLGAIVFLVYMRRPHLRLTKYNVLAALCMAVTAIMFMFANKLTTAANAIVLQYTSPVIIFLYSVIFGKKKPSAVEAVLVFIVMLGCVLSFADRLDKGSFIGNLLALASAFTFAGLIIINNRPETDAMESQLLGNLISMAVTLPFVFFDDALTFTWPIIGVALYQGICQFGLAHVLFGIGIKRTDYVSASLILTLEPILAPVWAFIVLREIPGVMAIIGFFVVLLGVSAYTLLPYIRAAVYKRRGAPAGAAGKGEE